MIEINKELLDSLFVQAESSDRKRINHDLRTSLNDGGQRMLNAMLRSTIVPIHRHPMSNENVILLVGKMDEVFYDDNGIETEGVDAKIKALSMYRGVMRPYPHPRSADYITGLAAMRGGQWRQMYSEAFEVVLRAY